ncbi:type I restriction endonuclease subunit R [Orbaceae bacterium ESL0721]|nr:type I restriction endonuclease subunit R [Orbaceae bacterium ESL0721]
MYELNPVAESNNYIVLDKYNKIREERASYQSEDALEIDFIRDLIRQGYEYLPDLTQHEQLLANVRRQLQILNNMEFTDSEWERFRKEYLDKANDSVIDKTAKIHNNHIYDFVFDDGEIQNISLIDKINLHKNKLQVINQFQQTGSQKNRYDVTILVNGLPLVQVELKKRGVAIREAFNQIHRYSKESFNKENSLFKYLQIFVISNGTNTRYFANTTSRNKNSFDFTINWARADNEPIKDLTDFTSTFFQQNVLLNVLFRYSIFDTTNNLLIMRPYQIAATERILWKIKSSYNESKWSKPNSGGYIWHTTGSGKTLTSFKAARLATELDIIDKVFFVVDRKDLDFQTMKEYQRFSPDSVNGSSSTAGLKSNILKSDNKIIVTTLQKLNKLMHSGEDLPIYQKQVVFIFDEAHRSQFGETQKILVRKFKKFYQFGFTGTPIFEDNALGSKTTEDVFGPPLHTYLITDAIRDEKVLKFKVDYNNVRPQFQSLESLQDLDKLSAAENRTALLHPNRIEQIARYILANFNHKTHRFSVNHKGFNAMFAVSSIDAAKLYYEAFKKLQIGSQNPLKIATIFSFAANEEQDAVGDIPDENFEPSALDISSKEFLTLAINDYNQLFKTNFDVSGNEFQNYYRDLSLRVKAKEVDLIIVVGMFLTGFDAPTLNTLFVDKNLRYHGLIQAFSRTNRIYDATKNCGNIVAFRDLEQATIDAIQLFCDPNNKNVSDIVIERSFYDYMYGYSDENTGKHHIGYIDIVTELRNQFSDPDEIITEKAKKAFIELFSHYLRIDNILQNYDEYSCLQKLQTIDITDEAAIDALREEFAITSDELATMQQITVPSQRIIQDYRSTYHDIRDWLRREKENKNPQIDWNDVIFEVDLLKSQEIDLDYILTLIFEHKEQSGDKENVIEEGRRLIRSTVNCRDKEALLVDFLDQADLDQIPNKEAIIDDFFQFAEKELQRESAQIISEENLNHDDAMRYIARSLKRGYASDQGTDLNQMMPKMSPLNPNYLLRKQRVFEKLSKLVNTFLGLNGESKG